jgi:tRNA pseudouridine38-40 synthase
MGWQRQAHGPSVQQAIEEAVRAITGEAVTLHAAGRTMRGCTLWR